MHSKHGLHWFLSVANGGVAIACFMQSSENKTNTMYFVQSKTRSGLGPSAQSLFLAMDHIAKKMACDAPRKRRRERGVEADAKCVHDNEKQEGPSCMSNCRAKRTRTRASSEVLHSEENWVRGALHLLEFAFIVRFVTEEDAKPLDHQLECELIPAKEFTVQPKTHKTKPFELHALESFGDVRVNSVDHDKTATLVRRKYNDTIAQRLATKLAPLLAATHMKKGTHPPVRCLCIPFSSTEHRVTVGTPAKTPTQAPKPPTTGNPASIANTGTSRSRHLRQSPRAGSVRTTTHRASRRHVSKLEVLRKTEMCWHYANGSCSRSAGEFAE